ncbi:hypothetical protein O181_083795 [Austropuccinia psidii MF-1]|uniref:Cation efflux protein transmembrane domain-containing protein n=1 Tax=Austropuccinia psidii MF-1 TaxID=1389203 RepID=A0A9Q3FNW2_9BASI|nr:hypothetical protein [Austropuccinia psidii MF-1]
MTEKLTKSHRLIIIIFISAIFSVSELSVGFWTSSLALIADGFHVINDLISFIVALIATTKAKAYLNPQPTSLFTFGWERAEILGALFNGVFLLALSVSIFLQSIERFLRPTPIEHPTMIIIVAGIGLALNILSMITVHDHSHSHSHSHSHTHTDFLQKPPYLQKPESSLNQNLESKSLNQSSSTTGLQIRNFSCSNTLPLQNSSSNQVLETKNLHNCSKSHKSPHSTHDLNMLGVGLHLIGDAFGNLLVICSALIYQKTKFVHVDTIASVLVAIVILSTSIPLIKPSARILLEAGPEQIDMTTLTKEIIQCHNVLGVTKIHVWQLNQTNLVATVKIILSQFSVDDFQLTQTQLEECMDRWGIHQVNIHPVFFQNHFAQTFLPPKVSLEE